MARVQPSRLALDWVTRAVRYDRGHRLSPASPLFCHLGRYPKPTALELDVHDGFEVGIVLTGEEERHYQDHTVCCRPGDVWLCAVYEPHGWRVTSSDTKNVVLVFLLDFLGEEMLGDVSWLDLFAVPPRQRPLVSGEEMRQQMLAIGWELREEITQKRRYWWSSVRLHLLRMLLTLARQWRPRRADRWGPEGSLLLHANDLSRIMPAVTLIYHHPDRRVTTEEAAVACGFSRSHFNRIFARTMGMSFGEFGLRARLAFAAHLLLTTRLPIESIATHAGFANAGHLHRAFVRHYGCRPGRYREQAQSGPSKGSRG